MVNDNELVWEYTSAGAMGKEPLPNEVEINIKDQEPPTLSHGSIEELQITCKEAIFTIDGENPDFHVCARSTSLNLKKKTWTANYNTV